MEVLWCFGGAWCWCFVVEIFGVLAAFGSGGGRGGTELRFGPQFSVLLAATVLGVVFAMILAVVPCPSDDFSGGVFFVLGGCFRFAVVPTVWILVHLVVVVCR
jgi:hypothetical protein